uniref:Uncharacterized protein n=1 Tax=Oryza nivara TaxID=4536 RepID=A0A0E0IXW6_ORYNI
MAAATVTTKTPGTGAYKECTGLAQMVIITKAVVPVSEDDDQITITILDSVNMGGGRGASMHRTVRIATRNVSQTLSAGDVAENRTKSYLSRPSRDNDVLGWWGHDSVRAAEPAQL